MNDINNINNPYSCNKPPKEQGFTLIELIIVIVILGILAVTAAPRFIDVGTDARISKVKQMAATLRATANMVFYKCQVNDNCDPSQTSQAVTMDGISYQLNFGYPDAGNSIDNNQVDTLFDHDGFTVAIDNHSRSYFRLTSAPDPENCAVTYRDSYDYASNPNVDITLETSGC